MRTKLLVCLFAIAISALAQQKSKYPGFSKSPTEHIIIERKQPFEVQTVRGLITRNGGAHEPLRDVLVEIKGPGDRTGIRHSRTDEKGQFRIRHVPAGTYTFKATLSGFQSVVGTIIVTKKAPKDSRIKIAMLVGV